MSSPHLLHHHLICPPPPPSQQQPPSPQLQPPPKTLRSRLRRLCNSGHLSAAHHLLLSSLPIVTNKSNPHSTTILFNTLLISYLHHHLPLPALRLFSLFSSLRIPLDHYSLSSTLKACSLSRLLLAGKSIHSHLLRNSSNFIRNNIVVNNSLLNMYASTLKWDCNDNGDLVRKVFDKMPKRNVVSWNTIINWYVTTGRFELALERFRAMIMAGIRPSTVSFVNVFPAVAAVESLNRWLAFVLYGMVVKSGGEFVEDQFVVSSAIFLFCEIGDVESARRVFDQAKERNTEVWNTMIGGYVQNGQYEDALRLLVEIVESGTVEADKVTYLSSMMAVSQLQDVMAGQQIHGYLMKEYGLELPLILWNALVVLYSRCGYVEVAFKIFEQMRDRDIVSWNTMISAFMQNNMHFEGLLMVRQMLKEGLCLDSVTLMALLSAASELNSIRIGKEAHAYLIRYGIQYEGIESYLIDMYAKSGRVETARQIFEGDQSDNRDRATWNSMIAGYTQNGRVEEAMLVFRNMVKEGQMPNSVTLASVLPACNPIGGIQAGKQVHGFAIRHNLDANVFVETALVDMYCKSSQISYAERIFNSMGIKNTVSYTTMLSGFGQNGLGERALDLFEAMLESGRKPDAITLVAVISACSYSGLVSEGLAIYNSMEDFGVVPSPEHHCCVVDLLGRAGRVEEAYQFVQRLCDEGNFVGIWGSLLSSCRVHGKTELAELVSDKIFEIGKEAGLAGYHVLLSNAYAADMNWDNVDRVRKEMRERGLRKEPGSSWIQVGDSSHRFMSRDQRHAEVDQIYSLLQELSLDMKSSGSEDLESCVADGGSEYD